MRLALACLLLTLMAPAALAQSAPMRVGDTVPSSVARRTYYAIRDTVLVRSEASETAPVLFRLLRGAEVYAYSESGPYRAIAQGERAAGFVLIRDVGRDRPSVVIAPTRPASDADVERLERRLESVHKQTTFLTIVTAVSLGITAITLFKTL